MNEQSRPRKRFGQHFLRDTQVLLRIVAAIHPKPDQNIVEIGPGEGALTTRLLPHIPTLKAVELDRDLIPILEQLKQEYPGFTVNNADALRFDFGSLSEAGKSLRIVGNLPYNISTPLIFHLLESCKDVSDMHFLLQKEVVDRLAAAPGDKHYGRLSVMTQYFCEAWSLFNVGPEAFRPPPKVQSAVVRLVVRNSPELEAHDFKHFSDMVRQAFSQRRKTLRRSLNTMATAEQIENAGIDSGIRPERIPVQQFVHLSNSLVETA